MAKKRGPKEMDLADARQAYYSSSTKTSDICRQLAFAGIALVWLLSGASLTDNRGLDIPGDLLWVGIWVVVALGLDLLHYAWRTLVWGAYAAYLEWKDRTRGGAPEAFNYVALALFWGKFAAVLTAYLCLLFAVLDRLE